MTSWGRVIGKATCLGPKGSPEQACGWEVLTAPPGGHCSGMPLVWPVRHGGLEASGRPADGSWGVWQQKAEVYLALALTPAQVQTLLGSPLAHERDRSDLRLLAHRGAGVGKRCSVQCGVS